MSGTQVQLHFVKGVINHRLRFGRPEAVTKLDPYRSLATFKPGSVFGYIRWRANDYGTQDWRVSVLSAQPCGYISEVAGVSPAAQVLLHVQGSPAVKRCLRAMDALETQAGGALETVPESYWPGFHNALLLRKPPRPLPRPILRIVTPNGAPHAR